MARWLSMLASLLFAGATWAAPIQLLKDINRTVRVGASDDESRDAKDVGGQASCNQFLNGFRGRYQNLSAHVAAFLR